ncbi:hypothetical protein BT96DRAFT_1010831 [Gymnopus androsaceus JB14]|uniref:RING-type domain-containing protein n=1 Tax=Gymnopus androsaceus JB14 TaxID=1447944 RepID=A0A6A4GA44_9AGAR|nr:hypothetical protein BT96DRAFT_1010831 [Gymnopus androsaceus JB14]
MSQDACELLHKTQNELSNLYKVQAERFNCGICAFTLRSPHALGCGHIYCEGCLAEFFDYHRKKGTRTVFCPTCQAEIGCEPPAALHLMKHNIELIVEEGGLNAEDIFVEQGKSLDWKTVAPRRRLQSSVRP